MGRGSSTQGLNQTPGGLQAPGIPRGSYLELEASCMNFDAS